MHADLDDPVVVGMLQECHFAQRDHHDVAVSGGADSTALLVLALATGATVRAHHVDHGLRPDGSREAAEVASMCRRWGAEFTSYSLQLSDGPDLEARCRDARMEVLPPGCLMGHTADDQAETVLFRLLRGSGPRGLAAMDTARHPLLGLRRAQTEALCEHLGVTPFEDPTNRSPRFVRNRIRHELLPLLDDVLDRDVVPILARTAELMRAQNEALDSLVQPVDPTDAAAMRSLPEAVMAEALRVWWRDQTDGLPPPDRAAVRRMGDVVAGTSRGAEIAAGWRMDRTAGRLRLTRDTPL